MDICRLELAEQELDKIRKLCNEARGAILTMTTLAKSGHPGGSMSTIDFLLTLLHLINIDPLHPEKEDRDMVIFSHGHVSPAAYSALGLLGYFPLEDAISQFRLSGSKFEGHVEPDVPGIEWASGNLGQGLSAACGFALAQKMKGIDSHLFVLMGDGEQQKGQLSEARRFAAKYDLSNITAFCDYNKLQISGAIETIMPQNIIENYLADEWDVIEIDGHDLEDIQESIFTAVENDNPTLILANTVMGKGVSFMENKEKYHGSPLSPDQLDAALKELGLKNELNRYLKLRKEFQPQEIKHPVPEFNLNTGSPKIYTERTDNRSAWGNAITEIARLNPEKPLAVFDCDLKGSVKLNDYASLVPDKYFQCGIMEHHAAVASGAMSKTGIQTFFADFGVFGVDETYNQHRLNDINGTNLKLITTHVGLDVGEDGKTHQCIDYLGVIRNLFNYRIIIPADPNQTDHIIRYIADKPGNFLIPMGRSKLDIIKDEEGKVFFAENYKFTYGKMDKLRSGDDAALLVMGTLTGRAVEVAEKLSRQNIHIQLWNVSTPQMIDPKVLREAASTGLIFTYEDHNVNTGLGCCVANKLVAEQLNCRLVKFGVENYAFSGDSEAIFKLYGLDSDSIVEKIKKALNN
ncbi:MAG: transketolase [Candidatus Cloacimonas sp. SDB]|nr:MAG: transketolase [Candidatus Cloacimonas sp. SDB]